jgi:predicted lipid-binding transport protein (Tim44 family)
MQMTTPTKLKRFTCGGLLSVVAVSAMLILGSASNANAWHQGRAHTFGGVVTGGAVGGIIGGVVGGKKGVIPGAIIGGVVGGAAANARRQPPPPRTYYQQPPAYTCGLVCGIQSSLIKLGYNPGPVDGAYGQKTADAISAFEYNNQLPVTGQATPQIHNYMKQLGG